MSIAAGLTQVYGHVQGWGTFWVAWWRACYLTQPNKFLKSSVCKASWKWLYMEDYWCKTLPSAFLSWPGLILQDDLWLVFTGPVCWTEKKTEIELNPTAKDRTTSCSCTNSEIFQLPVVRFVEKLKNQKKRVFCPIMCWTLLTHIFP